MSERHEKRAAATGALGGYLATQLPDASIMHRGMPQTAWKSALNRFKEWQLKTGRGTPIHGYDSLSRAFQKGVIGSGAGLLAYGMTDDPQSAAEAGIGSALVSEALAPNTKTRDLLYQIEDALRSKYVKAQLAHDHNRLSEFMLERYPKFEDWTPRNKVDVLNEWTRDLARQMSGKYDKELTIPEAIGGKSFVIHDPIGFDMDETTLDDPFKVRLRTGNSHFDTMTGSIALGEPSEETFLHELGHQKNRSTKWRSAGTKLQELSAKSENPILVNFLDRHARDARDVGILADEVRAWIHGASIGAKKNKDIGMYGKMLKKAALPIAGYAKNAVSGGLKVGAGLAGAGLLAHALMRKGDDK